MKSDVIVLIAAVAAVAAVVLGPRLINGGAASTPAVFQKGQASLRLAEAIDRSNAENKPVFAVVTATWCPPCQALKRGALEDEQVAGWLEQNTIPVYIDADDHPSEAQQLGASSIPASYLIRDGNVIANTTGNMSPTKYLAWLREGIAQ